MSFLTKVTHGAKHLDVRPKSGFFGHVVDTGEHLGAAYLAGRVNAQYGDKAKWRDREITYLAGVGGKLAAVLADIFGYGDGWAPHVNSLSMGLLSAHVAAVGASHGLEAAAPALPAKKVTGIGMIPSATGPGAVLDMGEVSRLAAMKSAT